jgi:uncharacterized membrane protein
MEQKKINNKEEKQKTKNLAFFFIGLAVILIITSYMSIGVFFVVMAKGAFGLFGSLFYSAVLSGISAIYIFMLLLVAFSKAKRK